MKVTQPQAAALFSQMCKRLKLSLEAILGQSSLPAPEDLTSVDANKLERVERLLEYVEACVWTLRTDLEKRPRQGEIPLGRMDVGGEIRAVYGNDPGMLDPLDLGALDLDAPAPKPKKAKKAKKKAKKGGN